MRKVLLFIKKGFLFTFGYKVAFFFTSLGIFVTIFIWSYISKAIGISNVTSFNKYNGDYFSFVLIGIALYRYISTGIRGFVEEIIKQIDHGTLESNWVTPTDPFIITLFSSFWGFIYVTIQIFIFLLLGAFIFKVNYDFSNFLPLCVVLGCSIFCFISIGIIIVAFVLIFKRAEPLLTFIGVSFLICSGVYFPVGVLPSTLQLFSKFFPLTYTLSAMRKILIQGGGFVEVHKEILILLLFDIILGILCFSIHKFAVRRNKLKGSLIFY